MAPTGPRAASRCPEAVFPNPDYLDAIFTAIRAFTNQIAASKRWLARAAETQSQPWRLAFLHEARAAAERARPCLTAASERLAELGPGESLPPPLNRIHDNLATMGADLVAHEEALRQAEGRETAKAIGRA